MLRQVVHMITTLLPRVENRDVTFVLPLFYQQDTCARNCSFEVRFVSPPDSKEAAQSVTQGNLGITFCRRHATRGACLMHLTPRHVQERVADVQKVNSSE